VKSLFQKKRVAQAERIPKAESFLPSLIKRCWSFSLLL